MSPEVVDRAEFLRWLDRVHPSLPASVRERLLEYGAAIASSHPRLGLVSRGDLNRVYMRHLRECLAPSLVSFFQPKARIIDVGSGAGLPGIPLGLVREDLEVWLVEPRERRAAFLERMVLTTRLKARVLPGTLERAMREHEEPVWDHAISRAVRWTPAMVESLRPRLTPEGAILRFGSPESPRPDVGTLSLDDPTRVVQIWPRSTWDDLPGAR